MHKLQEGAGQANDRPMICDCTKCKECISLQDRVIRKVMGMSWHGPIRSISQAVAYEFLKTNGPCTFKGLPRGIRAQSMRSLRERGMVIWRRSETGFVWEAAC